VPEGVSTRSAIKEKLKRRRASTNQSEMVGSDSKR
jgi:hypothetical protein